MDAWPMTFYPRDQFLPPAGEHLRTLHEKNGELLQAPRSLFSLHSQLLP